MSSVWHTVFEVNGPYGSLDGAAEAFDSKLKRLAEDRRVRSVRSEVLSDGIDDVPLFGPRPKIIGYKIEVQFESEFVSENG